MNQSRERFAKTISKCHVVLFCSHNWLLRGSFHFLFVNLAASSCVVLRMQPFTLSAKMFRATLVFVHKHTSRAAEMSTCVCVWCVCVETCVKSRRLHNRWNWLPLWLLLQQFGAKLVGSLILIRQVKCVYLVCCHCFMIIAAPYC